MAEALYRKYRPKIFEDVVGQEHIERTIKNAIEHDKVSHAYLFTGPRGTGKTTTARLLAKALLCQKGVTSEPDGTCEDCEMVANGQHPDVYELDAASRTGVENVREEIIGRVQYAPTRGRYKVYIIDEVHMLSTAAFNALLKTLEEPPSHVVFVLATTDPQKVPETIHSRCQRFDFRRISNDAIVSRLGAICVAEGVEFEGEALELIAHRAEGGMRNALTSLEQLIAFGDGSVSLEVAERMLGSLDSSDLAEIVRFVGQRDVAACFRWTAEYVETGSDLAQFTRDFAERIRNLYVMSLAGADIALDVSEAARREMAAELGMYGSDRLARLLGVLGELSAELKTSTNPRLSFEIALTRMVRPESELTLEGLAERLERLERLGGDVASGATMGAPDLAISSGFQPVSRPAGDLGRPSIEVSSASVPSPAASVGASSAGIMDDKRAEGARAEGARAASQDAALESAHVSNANAQEAQEAAAPADRLLANLRNPASLQRLWQQALAIVKKEKTAYGVLLLNVRVSYDEAATSLVVEFPAGNSFAYKAAQKPDVLDVLEGALSQACGAPLRVRLVQESPAADIGVANVGVANVGASYSAADFGSEARAVSYGADRAAQPEHATAPDNPAVEVSHPAYDEVPLDAYEDFPYGSSADEVAERGFPDPSEREGRRSDETRPAPVQMERESAGNPSEPSEPTLSDLDAMLAFGFGEGVEFREV